MEERADGFNSKPVITTLSYGEALRWAEELHRQQRSKGKPIPYIAHLISVSALVWENEQRTQRCRQPTRRTHEHSTLFPVLAVSLLQ